MNERRHILSLFIAQFNDVVVVVLLLLLHVRHFGLVKINNQNTVHRDLYSVCVCVCVACCSRLLHVEEEYIGLHLRTDGGISSCCCG